MTDRPILFSAPMVRALLAGTKTQTRRVLGGLGHQPIVEYDGMYMWKEGYRWGAVAGPRFPPGVRFAVGDRLYVREAWCTFPEHDKTRPSELVVGTGILTIAGTGVVFPSQLWGRIRPGMHMPRWASRLALPVVDVRVQRLQDIDEADARAEGVVPLVRGDGGVVFPVPGSEDYANTAKGAYRKLWNHLNEPRGFGWDANPWVVAVSFTVERANIDSENQKEKKA